MAAALSSTCLEIEVADLLRGSETDRVHPTYPDRRFRPDGYRCFPGAPTDCPGRHRIAGSTLRREQRDSSLSKDRNGHHGETNSLFMNTKSVAMEEYVRKHDDAWGPAAGRVEIVYFASMQLIDLFHLLPSVPWPISYPIPTQSFPAACR